MKLFITLILISFSSQLFAGYKISCVAETEMEYNQVNTLDNQLVKDEWKKSNTPSTLNIEKINDDYILINGTKEKITEKIDGVLLMTTSSKKFPGSNKDQGTIVMVSLAINMVIPAVTKTTLMAKYFLSSDIQATATNYKCKSNN